MSEVWPYTIQPHEILSTEIGEISMTDNGILVVRYMDNLDFTLEKAKSGIQVCEEIVADEKVRVMIITGEFGHMESETRKYLSSKEVANHRKAVALVINNLPHRLIANFIIKLRKNHYPSQVFGNEKDALIWLQTLN